MPCLECVALVAEGLEVVEGVGATVAFSNDMVAVGCRCCAPDAERRAGEGQLAELLP